MTTINDDSATEAAREFRFTDEHFHRIQQRLSDYAGIALSDIKKDMVYNRLSRRLRSCHLSCVGDYLTLLDDPLRGPQEFVHFINAMTTNLTAFFREPHHFSYLKETLLPELLNQRHRPLRIWSAGCSIGEEPYSVAILLDQMLSDGQSARILATDIDTQVLNTAREGIYDRQRVDKLSADVLQRAFLRGKGKQQGMVRVKGRIRSMVEFRALNLNSDWPEEAAFDMIFCRNVMIYFDKPTQRKLLERIADSLAPGGTLFIGHSESLHNISDRFTLIGQTIYRRID